MNAALATSKPLGQSRCQCMGCGEYFNRVSTFDKHRQGEFGVSRYCMTQVEMLAKGWSLNQSGFWVTAGGNWRTAP